MNRAKSEILYFNWPESKLDTRLIQKEERVKVGVEIGKGMETLNWESRLPDIKGKLLQWEERDLTFTGKILVIKAEVLASLTFLAATPASTQDSSHLFETHHVPIHLELPTRTCQKRHHVQNSG